eukprot:TRINITY_DN18717_c0_g1_i1.p1 TRINITY_DN18717_c0_g1~~TRINITY_DN18717_c0_g1_i1.p1  ORF type:complete len:412 (-),score=77.53 TRINITY_DN18717_c0_g1_i1:54-1289(-)
MLCLRLLRVKVTRGSRLCSTAAEDSLELSRVRIPTYQAPREFHQRIEGLIEGRGIKDLRPHVMHLTQGLQEHTKDKQNPGAPLTFKRAKRGPNRSSYDDDLALAYSCVRMPATQAVTSRVFQEIAKRLPDFHPRSMLDFGSGTGAAIWSALETWEGLEDIQAVEVNRSMSDLSKKLLAGDEERVTWMNKFNESNARSDLVIASYVLGEIAQTQRAATVKRLWERTEKCLVLVEPGSRRGAGLIDDMRSVILSRENSKFRKKIVKLDDFELDGLDSVYSLQKAHSLAPYSFEQRCPLPHTTWCHFGQRLQRSRLMLQLKQSTVPYEDEKFTYTVLVRGPRNPADPAQSWPRIVSEPIRRRGHVVMDVCTAAGEYSRHVVSKADGVDFGYKQARKAAWGDLWPFPFPDEPVNQ